VTRPSGVVCVGDLFVEYLLTAVSPGATRIVDAARRALGGCAFNVCWHLASLGIRPRLVVPFSRHERARVAAAAARGVSVSRIVWTSGPPDTLVVLSSRAGHRAVYVRAELPRDTTERIVRACAGARQVVLAGSRHRAVRQAFLELTRRGDPARLVFSPSYAVYEFTGQDLRALVSRAGLVILNEAEAAFVAAALGCDGVPALAERAGHTLIVTRADRGARLYAPTGTVTVTSLSGTPGDVIGAGDAFLAGYLYDTAHGSSAAAAVGFASGIAAQVARARRVRAPVSARVARRLALGVASRRRARGAAVPRRRTRRR
jgi:sugar/nucleoside kinase (ribokinase family)